VRGIEFLCQCRPGGAVGDEARGRRAVAGGFRQRREHVRRVREGGVRGEYGREARALHIGAEFGQLDGAIFRIGADQPFRERGEGMPHGAGARKAHIGGQALCPAREGRVAQVAN
jgi:hypothetical protein